MNIYDTERSQFTIPDGMLGLPLRTPEILDRSPDLLFNYETSPFSFWITRRSDPNAFPLFDTRISSLPKTPTLPVVPEIPSTSLDGFPLIFEDRYLQVCDNRFPTIQFFRRLLTAHICSSTGHEHLRSGRGRCQQWVPTRHSRRICPNDVE